MDGRGRVVDNIFTERLWRSVKYEEFYLHDYASPWKARQSLRRYFHFYNFERPHQALDYRTPAELYYQGHAAQLLFAERRSLAQTHVVSCPKILVHPKASQTTAIQANAGRVQARSDLSYEIYQTREENEMENEHLEAVMQAVIDGDQEQTVRAVEAALSARLDPLIILREGLTQGADAVGRYFEEGTYFLPQLMMSGNALKAAMDLVLPAIKETHPEGGDQNTGVIVMATVQTDVHDIGKNLVSSMLSANGFAVHDLGVDVPIKAIIEEAEKVSADIIGCSALLTTSMPYMRDLIEMLKARNLRERYGVMVGGASVTPEFAESIGADGTAADPMNAVRLAKKLINDKRMTA